MVKDSSSEKTLEFAELQKVNLTQCFAHYHIKYQLFLSKMGQLRPLMFIFVFSNIKENIKYSNSDQKVYTLTTIPQPLF